MEGVYLIEFNKNIKYFVVGLIMEWVDGEGNVEECSEKLDLGGIMCLGLQLCYFEKGIKVYELYGSVIIYECYCYCYEVNNLLCFQIEKVGLKVFGLLVDKKLVEVIENFVYLWFVVVQFYLEFILILCDGYFLFVGFVKVVGQF